MRHDASVSERFAVRRTVMLWVWYGGYVAASTAWIVAAAGDFFPDLRRYLRTLSPAEITSAMLLFMGIVAFEFAMMFLYYRCPACGKALIQSQQATLFIRGGWLPDFNVTTCPGCGELLR